MENVQKTNTVGMHWHMEKRKKKDTTDILLREKRGEKRREDETII